MTTWLSPRVAALLVAAVAFLAYVPVLDGEFLEIDDDRFVRDNPAVHRLDLAQAVRYFTDPSTLATEAWRGTYRPLRTLDFAVDWRISGGRPWLFHLHGVLYHVIGSLLCLALFRRLSGGVGRGAVLGALLFAVHPVQTEAVAFITSRGDMLLLVTFLGALLLHVSGRRVAASFVLVLALFSKEAAVVFPAAALLADHCRRAPLRIRWYAIYAVLAGAYFLLWVHIQSQDPGQGGFGHHREWWGGSYGAGLLTTARALLYYGGLVVLPVRQVVDYFVTMTTGLDLGAGLGILLVLLAAVGAWRGGRPVRFAVLWSAITLLPVMNILFTVGTPAAERFLYLPMVGLCFLGGRLFARTQLAWIPLVCLFLLTVSRSRDWADHARLMESSREVTITQLGQIDLAHRELEAAREAEDRGDREGMIRHGEAVIRAADDLYADFEARVGVLPTGPIIFGKWEALDLLGRHEEAHAVAERAISEGYGGDRIHRMAASALQKLGREEEAARHIERAIELITEQGRDRPRLRQDGAALLNAAARKREAADQWVAARRLYSRSVRLLSDRRLNHEAFEGLERLFR